MSSVRFVLRLELGPKQIEFVEDHLNGLKQRMAEMSQLLDRSSTIEEFCINWDDKMGVT